MPRASTPVPRGEAPRNSAIQNAFIRRTMHAIERLAAQADEATLVAAMAAPNDVGTLARVLTDVGAIGPYIAPVQVGEDGKIEPGNLREQIRRTGVTIGQPAQV